MTDETPVAEPAQANLTPRDRYRTVLLALLLIASLLFLGFITFVPGTYRSRAQLRVLMHPPRIIFPTHEVGADYQTFKQTQIQMIKSRAILGPALRDSKVASLPLIKQQADAAAWLERNIEVTFPAGSELMTVSMTSDDPEVLEPIINAVVKSYLETVVEEDHQARIMRLDRLKKLYDRYQEELRTKRASLRTLANSVGSEDRATLVLKQQDKLEYLREVQKELRQVRFQQVKMKAELEWSKPVKPVPPREPFRLPPLELDKSESLLPRERVAEIEKSLSLASRMEATLRSEVVLAKAEVLKLNGTKIDLQGEQEDIALLTETARKIGQEVEALDVELQAPRRISVWTPAEPARRRSWWSAR